MRKVYLMGCLVMLVFVVIGCGGDGDTVIVQKPSGVQVLSPIGGEEWKIGETHTITWSTAGYDPDARIQIGLKDVRFSSEVGAGEALIAETSNTGSYTWTVSNYVEAWTWGGDGLGRSLSRWMTLGDGDVYKVVVYIVGTGVRDESDSVFSIVKTTPSITVLSPNGGEQWTIGETHRITWASEGVAKIRIEIYDDANDGASFAYLETNSGYYDWNVTDFSWSGINAGDQVKIRIVDAEMGSPSDTSDDYFSIVGGGLGRISP